MTSFVWAKLWIETLDDYKIGQLDDHLWRRFFEFVLLAKAYDQHGYLPEPRAIAWRLRCSVDEVQADFEALAVEDLELLTRDEHGWYVTNFVKRQESKMDAAERKRNQRDRERRDRYTSHGSHIDVTPRDENSTNRDTEERRGEERGEAEAEEIALPPPSPESLGDPPPPLPPHNITPEQAATPDPEFCRLWKEVCKELEPQMLRGTYDTYIRHIQPICRADGRAVFIAETEYIAEWCTADRGGGKRPIERALSAVAGETLVLQFLQNATGPPGGDR